MGLVTPFYVDPDTACRPAGSTALRYAQDDTNIKMPLRFLRRITLPTVPGRGGTCSPLYKIITPSAILSDIFVNKKDRILTVCKQNAN